MVAATGCHLGHSTPPATTTTVSTTTTTVRPTTTTVAVPSSPQASPAAAASLLVSAWAANNTAQALTVAVPSAVHTLLAVAYPGSNAISRGCTQAFPPIVCTYGPPGGGSSSLAIYEIYVTQTGSNWYVSGVTIEG